MHNLAWPAQDCGRSKRSVKDRLVGINLRRRKFSRVYLYTNGLGEKEQCQSCWLLQNEILFFSPVICLSFRVRKLLKLFFEDDSCTFQADFVWRTFIRRLSTILFGSGRNHGRPLILTTMGIVGAFPVVFHAVISPVTPVAWFVPVSRTLLTLLCECPYNTARELLILVTSTRVLLIINIWRSEIRGITEQYANWERISDSSWRRRPEIIVAYVTVYGSFRNVINVIRVA